ncbi:MAG TPA: mannitol dehydrogenase [Clostridiaceae bacterium]|nr:mannitol dehydrogenase [Clostridiaceae bacterium]
MQGVIFGAGNVGRGFIGELFSEADLEICFADVNEEIIQSINEKNQYPHIAVYNDDRQIKWITNVCAINSNDELSVIQKVTDADIIATCVGAKALPMIAPVLAKSVLSRILTTGRPVNIFLCENYHNVDQYMRSLLLKYIPETQIDLFNEKTGLISTSIGRMIPVSSPEIKDIHPAAIKVEQYKFLPYDGSALKGKIPEIPGLIWDPNVIFDFYSDRKLYLHNMGHSMTAYLAQYFDYEYIWQAIMNPIIRYFVRAAMLEAAVALSKKYQEPIEGLTDHVDNLLMRFGNKALQDTCKRVGQDPLRKLSLEDRFFGAYFMCLEQGICPNHISLGVAAGLLVLEKCEDFKFDNIESYLEEKISLLYKEQNSLHLIILLEQIDILRSGMDFNILIDFFDKYGPKNIA